MASSEHRSHFFIAFVSCALALGLVSGCASPRRQSTPPDYGPPAPTGELSAPQTGETYGPAEPPASVSSGESTGSSSPSAQPAADTAASATRLGWVVVLGPAGARALAYVGALRALEAERIPIRAVIASELGALSAALQLLLPSASQVDWALLKLKDGVYRSSSAVGSILGGALMPGADSGARLEQRLQEIFGDRRLESARIPLRIGIEQAGAIEFVADGNAARAIRAAAAWRDLIKPGYLEAGQPAQSAADQDPYPVQAARGYGEGRVLVLDALSDFDATTALPSPAQAPGDPSESSEPRFERALRERLTRVRNSPQALASLAAADRVIKIRLGGVRVSEFAQRSEAVFRGRQAILAEIQSLRQPVP